MLAGVTMTTKEGYSYLCNHNAAYCYSNNFCSQFVTTDTQDFLIAAISLFPTPMDIVTHLEVVVQL